MVSTPIGPPTSEMLISTAPMNTCNVQLSPSKVALINSAQSQANISGATPLPPYQPYTFAKNILTNVPNTQGHTFPVLYSAPVQFVTSTSDVQPSSLYTEYMQNPYNFGELPLKTTANVIEDANQSTEEVVNNSSQLDLNKNPEAEGKDDQQNMFQSSNYFCNDQNLVPPPGMEFLYGAEQKNSLIGQNVNIPISTTPSTT